jgi:hypothetical protein
MSDLNDDPVEIAKQRGLTVVLPDQFQLFIDLDQKDGTPSELIEGMALLQNYGIGVTVERTTRSSGGNQHIYLRLGTALTDTERILLQACLGSDSKRELLSWLRIKLQVKRHPTVFFEKEGA